MAMTKEEKDARARAWRKAYDARPEVKAKRKAYNNTPKAKAWQAGYQQQYSREVLGRQPKEPAAPGSHIRNQRRYYDKIASELTAYNTLPAERARALLTSRLRRLATTTKGNAKKRKIEHTITYIDLLELYDAQEGKCALTGWDLVLHRNSPATISIDRIDNAIGYIQGNRQLVAWQANAAKNEWDLGQFIALCEAVVKRQHAAG